MTLNLPAGIDGSLLLLLVPVVVIQLGLMLIAVFDLLRDDRRVRGGSKPMWALIIVFVNLLGPILYFAIGREEGPIDEEPGPGAVPGWGSPHDPPIATSPRTLPDGTEATAGPVPPWPAAIPTVAPGGPGAAGGPVAAIAGPATAPAVAPRVTALPDAPPAILVERLSRRYPGGVLALDGLELSVPTGSVFGLLGPNGAGKTTCLRLLAGLTRATTGRATVDGLDPAERPIEVRRRLGYLEQDPRAYGWMTGREQLRLIGRLHGLAGPALESAIDDALRRVDLGAAADRRAGGYSGGMRQRLGIAGALVHRPPIVILDEPVSALDPEGRRDVLGLIASLRRETTVMFSSHVLGDVERICDRVAILDHGRLVVEGALGELLDRYAQPVWRVEAEPGEGAALEALAARLRELDWVTAALAEHGVLTVAVSDTARASRELLPAVAAAGVPVVSVARARPTLEDVFLRLTGDTPEVAA